jgi:hypothetical protein
VNVPCIRAGGCTERCNPSTLSVGCSPTREPTRVTTRTPAWVTTRVNWVDPSVTALMPVQPVSQYGRPPLPYRQLGSHCRRQVESLCRHGTASAESLPAQHGRAPNPFFLQAMPAISPHGNLPSAGTHQSVATPQAVRRWARPPYRHIKIQSCCCLGSGSRVRTHLGPTPAPGAAVARG